MTLANLTYFLQSYFPERLEKFPKSRFLFAYSGHGMTEHERGYLLESTADSLKDRAHSINLDVLQSLVKEVFLFGHQVLVLLNSCCGGAFLKRSGGKTLIPQYPGAHAITAGGSGELTWHDASLGKGSVFYEKIIAGLSGIADTHPDRIITANELATYLINEIRASSSQGQNPQIGNISVNGSRGEFFFLNKDTRVAEVKEGKGARKTTSFGDDAKNLLEEGKRLYDEKKYDEAFPKLEQAAKTGNAEGMVYLASLMYENGKDYIEVKKWYCKAADAGSAEGMSMLGAANLDNKDYANAAIWYLKAAEAGSAVGMNRTGFLYENGTGVAKDYDEAVKWYRKSAETGNADGMLNLDLMYKAGKISSNAYNESTRLYQKNSANSLVRIISPTIK